MLPGALVSGGLVPQLQAVGLPHIRDLFLGLRQFGVEGLATGLLPLHLEAAIHGQPNRLDCCGLKNLALSKWTDHALTRASGLGMAGLRHVFLDEPCGNGLSVGIVCVGVDLALDGFHLVHSNVRHG